MHGGLRAGGGGVTTSPKRSHEPAPPCFRCAWRDGESPSANRDGDLQFGLGGSAVAGRRDAVEVAQLG